MVILSKVKETGQVASNLGRAFDPRYTGAKTLPFSESRKLVDKAPAVLTKHVVSVLDRVSRQNTTKGSPNTYPKIYPESPDYYFRKRGR